MRSRGLMALVLTILLIGVYGVSGCTNRPRPECGCEIRGVDLPERWVGVDYITLGSSVGSFMDDIPCEIELPPEGGHATLRLHLENLPSGHVDFIACACITSGRGTRSTSILINRAAETVDVSASVTLQGGQNASASIYVAYRVGVLEMRDRVDITMRSTESEGPVQFTLVETTSSSESSSTSTTFSPGTVKWITKGKPESVEIGVDPEEVEVNAGEVARYSISVPFSGGKFRLEGLPSGFRYLLTPSGSEGQYTLKVFTPFSAYGVFRMRIRVEGQGRVGEHDLKLIVRKGTSTSTQASESPTTSEERVSSTATPEAPATATSSSKEAVTTVITTVVSRSPYYLALLPVAAALLAIIAVLVLRRRSS